MITRKKFSQILTLVDTVADMVHDECLRGNIRPDELLASERHIQRLIANIMSITEPDAEINEQLANLREIFGEEL